MVVDIGIPFLVVFSENKSEVVVVNGEGLS
jgi:hypothetical protein